MTRPKCIGIIGRVFGHKFRVGYVPGLHYICLRCGLTER